ncbi:hypothetical protein GCM10009847_03030 [Leucobacter tardus]|uniref:LCP family protein n=1 Tax=Leucobacter tardus TaxID=501483 RepID=A0A939TIU3_9MICO|nr:LCP family protein [Leucobacter tardus]MBO2988511.1 LCP family protein [Leucobacter tardus]
MHTPQRPSLPPTTQSPTTMSSSRRRRLLVTLAVALVLVLAIIAVFAAFIFRHVDENITRSEFDLPGIDTAEDPGEMNVLIMGLDSRLDQNGEALPDDVYQALHAGGADDGGYNANTLILLHLPEDRSQAVGISIPRDDYVELAGAPLGVTHGKVKEAYGLALEQRLEELRATGEIPDADEAYQEARAAGRQAQIETVSQLLGDVRIDHFVEVTMGGFFHIADAVQPIEVCLNQATEDLYSGADFAAGVQQLDAEQAMSFVRQRRDTGESGVFLTDLDRSRRQQAFLVGLANRLRDTETLTQPKTVTSLVDATQSSVALDAEFELLSFLKVAKEVSDHGLEFVTLPIEEFGVVDGSDVNLVDVDEIQRIVAGLLAPAEPVDETDEADERGEANASGEPDADTAEGAGGGAPTASDTPDPGAHAESDGEALDDGSGPDVEVYESWDQPIAAGAIPCVN